MSAELSGVKIAMLVADGFEQVELVEPKRALENVGAVVHIVSPADKKVQGWNHDERADQFVVDMPLDKVNAIDYAALMLPGGVMNPDNLRLLPRAIEFIKQIAQAGKPIAAICHGSWPLIDAGVVKGHTMTSWSSIKTDLINAGANWVNEPVVCDGNLVTSRNPNDLPMFNAAMIKLFAERCKK
jgi:protease I